MKNLFVALLGALILFTQFVSYRQGAPGPSGSVTLVWATGLNPARAEQVEVFYQWLAKNKYPKISVVMDNAGLGMQKFIIQGTSGVAPDLVDIFSQSLSSVSYLKEMGLLEGVDDLEKKFGLPDRDVWEPLRPLLMENGRQMAFPANHAPDGFLVNSEMFHQVGMEVPPFLWTFDEFEKIGLEYTRRAREKKGKNFFFTHVIPYEVCRRSAGIALFNETMTAPVMNGPRLVALLKRVDHWRRDLGLAPGAAESSSFNVESGAMMGNWQWQVFHRGQFATIMGNSATLIQLRAMGHTGELTSVLPPHGGFPQVVAKTRAVGLYAGSKNKEAAKYFLAFLRSAEYNQLVIKQTDAIPPNVKYLETEGFLRPEGHTNEWGLHRGFAAMVKDYAAPVEYSPYALMPNLDRIAGRLYDQFDNRLISAEAVAAGMEAGFANEIKDFLSKRRALEEKYRRALGRQKQIDELKARGEKVPLDLVENPFTRVMLSRR